MAQFLNNVSGTDTRALLGDGEGVFVGKGVNVESTENAAIVSAIGASSNHTATIAGSLVGHLSGLILGNDESDHDQALLVWAGAEVRGESQYGAVLIGSHSTVNNAGSLFGGFAGLAIEPGGGTASSIKNAGLIEGNNIGIYSINNGSKALAVTNSGTVTGLAYSFFENADGPVKLVNTGQMFGRVFLGDGGGTYDGRHGHVDDAVHGGTGKDKIYGGSEANKLSGGKGDDTLLGGKGHDTFIFDAALNAKTNVDHIQDFSAKDDTFQLALSVFQGFQYDGAAHADQFHIGNHAADKQDRIIYDQQHGNLYFDQDGKGGDKAVLFAHLDNHAALSHADFFILDNI